jgi:hypothetical protein
MRETSFHSEDTRAPSRNFVENIVPTTRFSWCLIGMVLSGLNIEIVSESSGGTPVPPLTVDILYRMYERVFEGGLLGKRVALRANSAVVAGRNLTAFMGKLVKRQGFPLPDHYLNIGYGLSPYLTPPYGNPLDGHAVSNGQGTV